MRGELRDDYCVIDIETVPIRFDDPDVVDYQIDKSFNRDFHPFFTKVIAAGVKPAGDLAKIWKGDDEKLILRSLWDQLRDIGPALYVTFNGYQFDIPFLHIRSKFQHIRPSVDINLNMWKMEDSNHFDCMLALSSKRTFPWVSLEITCRLFDIQIPSPRTRGSDIQKLHRIGDWQAIEQHNAQDLELTEALYKALSD